MQRRHQEAAYRANVQNGMSQEAAYRANIQNGMSIFAKGFCAPRYDGHVLQAKCCYNAKLLYMYGKEQVSVQAGEAVLVLHSGHEEWWIVRNVRGEEGFLSKYCLDPRTAQPVARHNL